MKTNCKYILSPPIKPWEVNYSNPGSTDSPPFESLYDLCDSAVNTLNLFSCEEIQKYLKGKYRLGVFNLTLPFKYRPNEDSHQSLP